MQYSPNKDHQLLKWQQHKSWISSPDCLVAQDKQQTQYRLKPKWKWKMLPNYWKFPNRNVQTFGFVYRNTNGPNHGQHWRPSRSSWAKSVRSSFGRTIMGKAIWENPTETWLGENSKFGMSLCTSWKRIILICVCGWNKIGWKETKHWSDVESTQQRSRFGRTNIFPWSCILGMHSKTMWNKQRYCVQLQTHVWIANFRGENRKAFILWEFSFFFMVLRYGRSCKEMCGAILWVSTQDDSTKYLHHALMTITSKKKKKWNPWENCRKYALKLFWKAYTWHGLGDRIFYGQMNKLSRSITKWTKACDKRLNRLISKIHHTCEYKRYCYVGNTAKHCRLGLFQDSDFAGDFEVS